jgi:HNH endonuclease
MANPYANGRTAEERFWSRVEKGDGCWQWKGSLSDGYGSLSFNGVISRAHRVAYALLRGSLPEGGLVLDHTCRNRACVNPDHLEPVTNRENILRGENPAAKNKRKTHCCHGHELSGENLTVHKSGKRKCTTCTLRWHQESYERRKIRRSTVGGEGTA